AYSGCAPVPAVFSWGVPASCQSVSFQGWNAVQKLNAAFGSAALRCQDGNDLPGGRRDLVVDHHVVVMGNLLALLPGLLAPALDDLLLVGGPAVEAAGEVFKGGGHDEDKHRVGAFGPHLGGALNL